MKKNTNVFLGEKFIETTLDNVEIKDAMSSQALGRFLMRAAMAGGLVVFGYLVYFALSANFGSIEAANGSTFEPFGKMVAGFFFSGCLVAIYYTKSELLTSNMMITTVGRYFGKLTFGKMFKIMGFCLLGNLIGGLVIGALVGASTIISPGMEEIMIHTLEVKQGYIAEGHIIDLLIRALFCNFFINVSMLMVYSGNMKDDFGKVIAMVFGVFIFMYLGLEHSVANTVLFCTAFFFDLFHGTNHLVLTEAIQNVFWVLIGNYIGGGLLIGAYYAFINDSRKAKQQ